MNLLTDILILFLLAGLCVLTAGGTIWLLQGGRDITEEERNGAFREIVKMEAYLLELEQTERGKR